MQHSPVISIIDDDESLRSALVALVRSIGYAGAAFESAEDFLASGDLRRYACIITDIHMPGMSGIELMLFLKASGCKAPVIMMTAHSEEGLKDSALASGAIRLFKKPFDAKGMIACLEEALAD